MKHQANYRRGVCLWRRLSRHPPYRRRPPAMPTWEEYVQELGSLNSRALVEHAMALEWSESADALTEFRRDIIRDPNVRVANWQQTHAVDWAKWSDLLVSRGETAVLKALDAHRLHKYRVEALTDWDVCSIARPDEQLEASYAAMQPDEQRLEAAQEARVLLHRRLRQSDHTLSQPELRDVLSLFSSSELTGALTHSARGAGAHSARGASGTERSAVLMIPACITVQELIKRVRAAWATEHLPQRLGSELWAFASQIWPRLCDLRVRDDGDAPLFSDAVDGSTEGDELYGSDVLCASDATKCVNALEHMRAQKTTHSAILHYELTLADAVLVVLKKINTATRVPGKPRLILAVARKFDNERGTPVLNAFAAALHSQAANERRALSQAFTLQHRCTLSLIARQFYVHIFQPRGGYIEVRHYCQTQPRHCLSPRTHVYC